MVRFRWLDFDGWILLVRFKFWFVDQGGVDQRKTAAQLQNCRTNLSGLTSTLPTEGPATLSFFGATGALIGDCLQIR